MKILMIIANMITALMGLSMTFIVFYGTAFADTKDGQKYVPFFIALGIVIPIITTLWIIFVIKKDSLLLAYAPTVLFILLSFWVSAEDRIKKEEAYSKINDYQKDFICDGNQYDYIFIDTPNKQLMGVKDISGSPMIDPIGKIEDSNLRLFRGEEWYKKFIGSCKNKDDKGLADIYALDFSRNYKEEGGQKLTDYKDYNPDQYRAE